MQGALLLRVMIAMMRRMMMRMRRMRRMIMRMRTKRRMRGMMMMSSTPRSWRIKEKEEEDVAHSTLVEDDFFSFFPPVTQLHCSGQSTGATEDEAAPVKGKGVPGECRSHSG